MKKAMVVMICISLFLNTFAQNILCREFGANYEDVLSFLKERENVDVKLNQDERLVASTPAFLVTYYFHNQKLYRIFLQRNYDKKKDAENTMDGFATYFKLINAERVQQTETETGLSLNVTKGNRIYEVEMTRNADKKYEIRLTQADFSLSPVKPVPSFTPEEQAVYASILD